MIPVFEPSIDQDEVDAVVAALHRGEISGSFGESIPRFERDFATYCGCDHGVAVSSGTAALHLAVAALELERGDEVLVSGSTNIATALAAAHNGLVPVPVDAEAQTWNLDLDLVDTMVGPRTRAIMPVHLYGCPVDMDRLCEVARRHELVVIEDCAEAHGATCRTRVVGSLGEMGCFSFYANKVITTGEGGMIITDNFHLAERLRLLRNLAFATPRFRHDLLGFNFRMTGYQAAMGVAQLHKIETIIDAKRRLAKTYTEFLSEVPGLQLPTEPEWGRHVFWMYAIVIDPEQAGTTRDALAVALADQGIETRTFFCPMNQQPCLKRFPGFRDVECPVADRLWENGIYLPSTPQLQRSTIEAVSDAVRRAVPAAASK